jgi:hypothetical protein
MSGLYINPGTIRRLMISAGLGVAMAGTAFLCAWYNQRDWIGYRWDHQREGNSYALFSFGRDGKRGGDGLDEDVDVSDSKFKNAEINREPRIAIPTLRQFAFECDTFGPRTTCILAGILASVACLVTFKPGPPRLRRALFGLGLTLAACFVTAIFISALEVPTHH